jgi:diguanylate cyclase (GGDEF)-like protein
MWDALYDSVFGTETQGAERLAGLTAAIDEGISALRLGATDAHLSEIVPQVVEAWESALAAHATLNDERLGDEQIRADRMYADVIPNLKRAGEAAELLQARALDHAREDLDSAITVEHQVTWAAAVMVLAVIAVGLILHKRIRRSVVRPLEALAAASKQVRHGDLSVRVGVVGPAELRMVAASFNEMVEQIADTERQLRHQALHDVLTGLPNRALALDRGNHALRRLRRQPGTVAAIVIDLDGFKKVNDSCGHSEGDAVLKDVAARVAECVRETDTSARLGGDEFLLIVEASLAEIEGIASRLVEATTGTRRFGATESFMSASVGVAVTRDADTDIEALVHDADIAMYRAKSDGGARWLLFDASFGDDVKRQVQLEAELRRAVTAGEFVVHYQPTVRLAGAEVCGAEALVRWQHPERGLLPPSAFIGVAERTGLIVPIGWHVLETACLQFERWRTAHSTPLTLSVNVSLRQLERDDFVERVVDILDRTGMPPHLLVLEITENTMASHHDVLASRLGQIREVGVRVALDDFGTGYSSLSYLRDLPVDILKVDKAFIDGVATMSNSTSLVAALIHIAHSLGLYVIAEGIEDNDQAATLINLGCEEGQGFLFYRPLPAHELELMLIAPAIQAARELHRSLPRSTA